MKEAILYDKTGGKNVRCRLCAHGCLITDGRRGLCGIRENNRGILYALTYGRPCALHIDPIEKKPLYHFLPGTRTYSIATVGCNLRCKNCQNWEISQMPKKGGKITDEEVSPEEIVDEAKTTGCASIAYTYTEPTVYMEYALDTSILAKKEGLRNVFVSNGYMTEDSIGLIAPHLHADNVDLKSFSDKFYKETCGGSLEPVLRTLKDLVKRGVWVEVTTLIIPTQNDSPEELGQIASFIKEELGEHVPWHVSAFHPDYEMTELPQTSVETIRMAVGIGKENGLRYIYAGNVPHERYENTYCPKCSELLIERHGFIVSDKCIKDGRCPKCHETIEGVWS
jgi:pyruvate formate lyase activating enzyme